MKKGQISCNNCGSLTHMFKQCDAPIKSYGIILLQIDMETSLKQKIIDYFVDENNVFDYENENKEINVTDLHDMELFSLLKNSIKVLLVQRKHSVGFIEFMRGRYNLNQVDGIVFLFKQMTPYEIELIRVKSFDYLWEYLWGENKVNVAHFNDYKVSKKQFENLKCAGDGYLDINFYCTNIVPDYVEPEWGFPKGRKDNIGEDDIVTAQREFREETNYNDTNYIILNKIDPIEESLIGTNGVNYKHIYYIAIAQNINSPYVDINNANQVNEVGDINFFMYENAINLIRPYHTDKQKIITQLYMFMMNKLINCVKNI